MVSYTAKYTKISSGYMGQLVEWPEVVTEGRDLEDCRKMLRDALKEMVLAYQQIGKEIPLRGNGDVHNIISFIILPESSCAVLQAVRLSEPPD